MLNSENINEAYLTQKMHDKDLENNALRLQCFQIVILDKNMDEIRKIDVATSHETEKTPIKSLFGKQRPHAILLNKGGYGYAKFIYDSVSLLAFETDLVKLKDDLDRKMLYN